MFLPYCTICDQQRHQNHLAGEEAPLPRVRREDNAKSEVLVCLVYFCCAALKFIALCNFDVRPEPCDTVKPGWCSGVAQLKGVLQQSKLWLLWWQFPRDHCKWRTCSIREGDSRR